MKNKTMGFNVAKKFSTRYELHGEYSIDLQRWIGSDDATSVGGCPTASQTITFFYTGANRSNDGSQTDTWNQEDYCA